MSALVKHRWTTPLFLLFLCAFLFFYGMHSGDLWRTESLRAIVAAEMLRTGNWVVPTLYGQPLLTKPPGMYVAIAMASWPVGEVTDWTARLPSALAASGTVFLFYWYFGRVLGRRGGLVAAAIVPVSVLWLDKAPSAEIDMVQVFWISASILFVCRALEGQAKQRRAGDVRPPVMDMTAGLPPPARYEFGWWLAALFCVAGGFLTKWTAPAFFYLTLIPLLWWRRELRLLFSWQHLLSMAVAGGLCLAWAGAAIHQVGWDEFSATVQREALQRLSARQFQETQQQLSVDHHDKLPAWLGTIAHPFAVLAMTLPWSILSLFSFRARFASLWDSRTRLLLQALHCWVWPNLLLWSLLPDHSPRYSLPLMPGISGLAALVCVAWLNGARMTRSGWRAGGVSPPWLHQSGTYARSSPRWITHALATTLAAWLIVKVAYVEVIAPHRLGRRELPSDTGARIAAAVPDGQTLYLCRLKDEGVMFYYGRPVRRLQTFTDLPSPGEPLYCMLEESEWRQGTIGRPVEAVLHLRDQQRAAIVLVKVLQ